MVVSVKHAHFAWSKDAATTADEHVILRDVSLSVRSGIICGISFHTHNSNVCHTGELVQIIGSVGSGKSLLVQGLLGEAERIGLQVWPK